MATYGPWSYSLFLDRIKTYSYSTWPVICPQFTPVDCVAQGWIALNPIDFCPDKSHSANPMHDRTVYLKCVTCSKVNVIYFPDSEFGIDRDHSVCFENYHNYQKFGKGNNGAVDDDSRTESLFEIFKSQLVSKHSDSCPWKKKISNNVYYQHLENLSATSVNEEYESRLLKLAAIFGKDDQKDGSSKDKENDKNNNNNNNVKDNSDNSAALVLYASMGWTPKETFDSPNTSESGHILQCDACFSRITRKNLLEVRSFITRCHRKRASGAVEELANNEVSLEQVKRNLESLHREYCAYLHFNSARGQEDTTKAYEKLLALKEKKTDEKSSSELSLNTNGFSDGKRKYVEYSKDNDDDFDKEILERTLHVADMFNLFRSKKTK